MNFIKKLRFKFKFWRAPIITSCDPATPDYDFCIQFKVVDGTTYVLKEYKNYKSVDSYQKALFDQLLPKMNGMFKAKSILDKKIAGLDE